MTLHLCMLCNHCFAGRRGGSYSSYLELAYMPPSLVPTCGFGYWIDKQVHMVRQEPGGPGCACIGQHVAASKHAG